MSDSSPLPPAPTKSKLVFATLAALLLACVVLVTVVLPAEYDIDPLGTGEALGLVVLSRPGTTDIPVREDGLVALGSSYRTDVRQFALGPGEFVEYKYRLEAGRAMLYSWSATNFVRSEMHSEVDGAPPGTAEFFEVAERTLFRHGSYVAPFPGIHGWYWLNEGRDSVTVTIHAAGFFDYAAEFRRGVAPIQYQLTDTPDPSWYRPTF
ncbi:MAG TPA: hypothetical protein VMM35_04920 [Longimicrobiales bacterium]|nr:hypothetical protein [Longimicrobiales bacterium]